MAKKAKKSQPKDNLAEYYRKGSEGAEYTTPTKASIAALTADADPTLFDRTSELISQSALANQSPDPSSLFARNSEILSQSGMGNDPKLNELSAMLAKLDTPSQPNRLDPQSAGLNDVQTALDQMETPPTPPTSVGAKLAVLGGNRPPSLQPISHTVLSPSPAPPDPQPIAREGLPAVRVPSSYDPDEEIRAIMEARNTNAAQAQSINDAALYSPSDLWAALGGIGTGMLSKGKIHATKDLLNQSRLQNEAIRNQRLKALDYQVKNTDALAQLALARAKQKAAMDVMLMQEGFKQLADDRKFGQQKDLENLRGGYKLSAAETKASGKSGGPKISAKDYGKAERALQGLKAMQSVSDSVTNLASMGKLGANTGIFGGVKALFNATDPKVENVRAKANAMKVPVSIVQAGGNQPTKEILKKTDELMPNIDREESVRTLAKNDQLWDKLVNDAEVPVKVLERAGDPKAAEYRAELEALKENFIQSRKQPEKPPSKPTPKAPGLVIPVGYIRFKNPATGQIKAFPKEDLRKWIDAGMEPMGEGEF